MMLALFNRAGRRAPLTIARLRATHFITDANGQLLSVAAGGYGAWEARCRRCRWKTLATGHVGAVQAALQHCASGRPVHW